MPERLGINYRLEITVLTPLHIGNGVTLLQDFDFAVHEGRTYRLNEDRILSDYWPADPAQQRKLLGQPPATLLQSGDYRRAENFRYVFDGTPELREIREQVKDARDRPYLPGSSLKGALRTALLRALTAGYTFQRSDFGPAGGAREAKEAAQPLERKLLGSTANRDILRAVHVGDSEPAVRSALILQRVQMIPRRRTPARPQFASGARASQLNLDVEAVRPGTVLGAALRLDTWLLNHRDLRAERGVNWPDTLVQRMREISRLAHSTAIRRMRYEQRYHAARGDALAARFYEERLKEATAADWPADLFLVQVGFASGWRSKVVLDQLADDDPLLERIVHDFHLDRGGGQSRRYSRGQPFPKARHLAWTEGRPALPMGWLCVRMIPEESP